MNRGRATELTAEHVTDAEVPQRPVLSPDGRWVAYAVGPSGLTRPWPRAALWIAAADGSSPPRRLTDGAAWDSRPRWSADSRSLLFASDRDHPGTPVPHRIAVDGGEAAALPVPAGCGAPLDHLPLGDGVTALIAREAPDPAAPDIVRSPAGRLWLTGSAAHPPRPVDGLADRHVVAMAPRPDGAALAVLSWAEPDIDPGVFTAQLHVVETATGAVRPLGATELEAGSPAWWYDAHTAAWHVCYLARTPPDPVSGLAVFDVAVPGPDDAAGEHRNLTAGMACCPTELAQVADGPPLALFAEGLDTAIHRLDPGAARFRRLCTLRGRAEALTADSSGEAVAALVTTAYRPRDVHAGPPGGPLVRLSHTRPELDGITWGTQERLGYTASDGLDLDGLLILPAGRGRDEGPFPLVTLVHGGPDERNADQLHLGAIPSGQWLATAGYAVFLPNPRGGTGHGHDFAARVAGRVGLEEWSDIEEGIDLLVAEGVADPDRLGIAGWSHGGFMAAWAVGRTERFKAALMGAGISDWGMLAATGEGGALEAALAGSHGWEGPGPHPHDRLSPLSYASRIRTPVLIAHGAEDTNVPLGQAVGFARALRHFGVPHELVVYPREGHPIRERGHQLDLMRRTREWFDRWLVGEAAG